MSDRMPAETSRYEIRPETPADRDAVHDVVRDAFGQTPEAVLVDRLRASAHPQVSLVAESDGRIAGHIFFSPVALRESDALAAGQLAPLSVSPKHQRVGVGSALVRAGLEACRGLGWCAVFLVGDPDYYGRFGFEMAAPRGFSLAGPHGEFLQVAALRAGALDGHSGEIRLHPSFDDLEADPEASAPQ